MQAIQAGGRGLWHLVSLNADRIIYIGAITAALMASSFLTTL